MKVLVGQVIWLKNVWQTVCQWKPLIQQLLYQILRNGVIELLELLCSLYDFTKIGAFESINIVDGACGHFSEETNEPSLT